MKSLTLYPHGCPRAAKELFFTFPTTMFVTMFIIITRRFAGASGAHLLNARLFQTAFYYYFKTTMTSHRLLWYPCTAGMVSINITISISVNSIIM